MRYVITTTELELCNVPWGMYYMKKDSERVYYMKKGSRQTYRWTCHINLASVFVCKKDAERRLAKVLQEYGTGELMEYDRLLVEDIMEV